MADYLTTVEKIKKAGNLEKVKDEYITEHLPSAKLDVIEMIGSTVYGLIKDAENVLPGNETEENKYNSEDFEKVQLAESYMAVPYVIGSKNNVSTGEGFHKATGFHESRKEMLSENEVESIEGRFERWAKNILKNYTTSVDDDEDDNDDMAETTDMILGAI